MKNNIPLSGMSVVGLWVAAALLFCSIALPWWGMKFIAPQYPEGLDIIVYPYKMDGRIDIINGLNHYIGMREFSEASFPELRYLPYAIGALALLCAVVAAVRKRSLLLLLAVVVAIGGALGLYDIHRWLYDFGSNLDPQAPIKVKPFVPPIIGKNTIANFVTHSYFTYGSFLLGAAALLIFASLWRERTK